MRYYVADAVNRNLNASAMILNSVKSLTTSKYYPLRKTKLGRAQTALLETGVRLCRHYPKRGWDYPDVQIGKHS